MKDQRRAALRFIKTLKEFGYWVNPNPKFKNKHWFELQKTNLTKENKDTLADYMDITYNVHIPILNSLRWSVSVEVSICIDNNKEPLEKYMKFSFDDSAKILKAKSFKKRIIGVEDFVINMIEYLKQSKFYDT